MHRQSADQEERFTRRLPNIENLLPTLFAGFQTDVYQRVEVELLFDGGEVWSASSDSQYGFMIPWEVRAGKSAFTTFNADISRSVANLLPLKSVNRDRLSGEFFKLRLADAVMARMEEQWLKPALSVLRLQYNVYRSEITSGVSIPYGQDRYPQQENALFVLRRDSFPQLFQDWVVLPFHDETVYAVNEFLKTAARYENLALSIPWLNEFRQERPIPIDLQFVQGRSLSEKAMGVFANDMNGKGRADLTKLVAAVQEETALVVVQGVYCLILPDKRVILWRFGNPPGSHAVLKWTREDLSSTECASYRPITEWCAGAVISPDGNLIR
jgi:hypothetical protein